MLMYNKSDLKELINAKTKRFWKIPQRNRNLSRKIRNIYKGINLLQIAMIIDAILILEGYALGPYLNSSNIFIFASNVFVNSIVMDVFVLICQYYCVALIAFIVLGYDFVYLSLCIELMVQVKLLKYKLKEVFTNSSENAAVNVGICVKQHNFLLL